MGKPRKKSFKNSATAKRSSKIDESERTLRKFYFPSQGNKKSRVIEAESRQEAEKIYHQ